MNNQYLDFWQNTISDMLGNKKPLESMDKIVEQSLSNIEDFTLMMQKMTDLDFFNPSFNYFKMIETPSFDFKQTYKDSLELFGLVSIEEYRSLVNKYEQLVNENKTLEKKQTGQSNSTAKLNKTVADQKKELTSIKKTMDDQKKKLAAQKKLAADLKKEVTKNNKQTDIFKADIIEKDKTIKELRAKKK